MVRQIKYLSLNGDSVEVMEDEGTFRLSYFQEYVIIVLYWGIGGK